MDESLLQGDATYRYQLLGRLQFDCDVYLNYVESGQTCDLKRLWASNEQEQVQAMKQLWNSFDEDAKPAWLTWEKICEYEDRFNAARESLEKISLERPKP